MEIRHNDNIYKPSQMSLLELRELEHTLRSEVTDIELQLAEAKRRYHEEGRDTPYEWRNKAEAAAQFKRNHIHLIVQYIQDKERSQSPTGKRISKTLKAIWDNTYMCTTPQEYQWLLDQIVTLLHEDANGYRKWVKAYHHQQDNWSTGEEPNGWT